MVFSSLAFVLVFLPIFFLFYYLAPARFKNLVLFVGSLTFYAVGAVEYPYHFALFLFSIFLDWFLGVCMEKKERYKKLYFALGLTMHLAALILFKYANFVTLEMSRLISGFDFYLDIGFPIGISFYTFQGLSYLADVYRGKSKAEKSFLRFGVYLSMFEQLIAGPIVTYDQVAEDLGERRIPVKEALQGLGTFIFGLGLKVLIANPIGNLWTQACNIGFESLSTPLAWMALFSFTFQIYFDFFGYSVMAIGLGKMLGFTIPKNFDHPYLSRSMTEFWRRWHMTLGSWFREYVYIPLGGNRKGWLRTVCNLMAVWLLTGLWHGDGYNFVLWGALLFIVLFLEKNVYGKLLDKLPLLGHLYMLLLIPLSWAVFAVEDASALGTLFTRLFPFFGQGPWSEFRLDYLAYAKDYWYFFLVGILFSTKLPYLALSKLREKKVLIGFFLAAVLLGSLYCMYRGFNDPFLYFRF